MTARGPAALARPSMARGIVRMLRPPNLFTAIAEPVAGLAIVRAGALSADDAGTFATVLAASSITRSYLAETHRLGTDCRAQPLSHPCARVMTSMKVGRVAVASLRVRRLQASVLIADLAISQPTERLLAWAFGSRVLSPPSGT